MKTRYLMWMVCALTITRAGAAESALTRQLPARDTVPAERQRFEPTSESLQHYEVPQWYDDAKFGIYFHWAPFSVPAHKSGLTVRLPNSKPCDFAVVLKISAKK